ncbi:FtsX-like permease family protein [Kitasatospora viridis]
MLGLALATVRHRKGGFAGAFVALFCAAALICGCGTLLTTGILGQVRPERYAAAPALVTGDQSVHEVEKQGKGKTKVKDKPIADRAWVPAALADRIAALPSVRSVTTEVTFPVLLPGGRTSESWGHGWESAPLAGLTPAAGRAPAAPDEVVLDAGTAARSHLAVGATVPARTAGGTLALHVVGVTAQGFTAQSAVYFGTVQARQLAGHDGLVSAIGVFPAQSSAQSAAQSAAQLPAQVRDLLRSTPTVPGAVVRTGADRGPAEFPDAADAAVRLISTGAVLAGTSVLVALLVVVGTFALSIQQRQREIAVLRAVAATGRQIRKMIGGEALLVGALAGSLGACAGLPLGSWLHDRFVALDVIPANLPVVLSPFPVLIAAAATLLAGWGAARISARRAAAIRPVQALGEAEVRPPRLSWGRVLFGVLVLAGAVTLTLVLNVLHSDAASSPVCFTAILLWCSALSLLGPPAVRGAVAVLGLPLRLSPVGGFLATQNLRAGAHRLASVITPLTLLTAMACGILFSGSTVSHAAQLQLDRGDLADYVVGPRVPADAAARLAAVPGVRTVTRVLHTQVRDGLTERSVQAVTPQRLSDTLDLAVTAGDLGALTGSAGTDVAPTDGAPAGGASAGGASADGVSADGVSADGTSADASRVDGTLAAATGLGYHLGQRVRLTLPDGTPAELTVVALYARGLGFGDLTLPHDLVAAHVDVPLDDEVLVRGDGLTRRALASALAADPGLGVLDGATARATQSSTSTEIGYVMLGLIVAFVAIAVLNTLAMSITDRRPEFAALRLVGATRRQVRRMLGWETAAAVLIATLLGLGIALAVLTGYADGITRGTAGIAVPPVQLGLVLAGAAALATVGTWLPARAAVRGPRGRG